MELGEIPQRFDAKNQRRLYSPSDFQSKILKLNFEEFVDRTNIIDLVETEYRKKNALLSDDDMQARLKFFYDFRSETHRWHINEIKNLRFIECGCQQRNSDANHDEIIMIPKTENIKSCQNAGDQCSTDFKGSEDKEANATDATDCTSFSLEDHLIDFIVPFNISIIQFSYFR